jgi:hypothetical protein
MLKSFEVILFDAPPGYNYPSCFSTFLKKVPLSICIERQITSLEAAYRPENQVYKINIPEYESKKTGP